MWVFTFSCSKVNNIYVAVAAASLREKFRLIMMSICLRMLQVVAVRKFLVLCVVVVVR